MNTEPGGGFAEVRGSKLRYHIEGKGGPVVVLEAGIAATSISWCMVRPPVAEFATVLSYDRAGFGSSGPPAHETTAAEAVADLAGLIESCGIAGPVILAGHSFGGLIVRLFQQRHPALVSGMVLVDPVVRAEWRKPTRYKRLMLARGVMLSRRGALLARAGVVRFALTRLRRGSTFLPKIMARVSSGPGAGVAARLTKEIRKLPPEFWPAIAENWSHPQGFFAMANYLENLPRSVSQLDETRGCGNLPLIVLSAASAGAQALEEHAHDAALSTRGEHRIVPNTGHWIPIDAPDAVSQAIREIVAAVG